MKCSDPNLPDDCQGFNLNFPWFQEDGPECPECNQPLIYKGDKWDWSCKCSDPECNYTDEGGLI